MKPVGHAIGVWKVEPGVSHLNPTEQRMQFARDSAPNDGL